MPSASKLISKYKTAVIGEGDDALHVTFKPGAFSPKVLHALSNDEKPTDAKAVFVTLDSMVDLIVRAVVEWDLTPDDDSPVVPLTTDAVSDLGVEVLNVIIAGIMEAVSVGETDGTRSLAPTNTPSSAKE